MVVTWKAYADGGHWIHEPQGVDDMADFFKELAADTLLPVLSHG